jgi:arylsulfatase A-like enzyme
MKNISLILLLVWCHAAVGQERRPNIVLMYTDDQPANCVGITGNPHIQTPNLDRLARRGVVFQNAFVTTAICCCNRACILTGQHMVRHGIRDFVTPLSFDAFDQTFPALLKKSGYRTGFLGKYAIGNPSRADRALSLPAEKFDFWYGFDQGINFKQEIDGKIRYLTEVMTEKAIEFLEASQKDKPFCLTIAFKEPHGPFNYYDPNAPDPYEGVDVPLSPTCTQGDFDALPAFLQKSLNADGSHTRLGGDAGSVKEKKNAYRMITRADQAVGKILDTLERLKLDDNTIVIFTSDHGSLLGDHGLSGKWLMYENSIRVPMIVANPLAAKSVEGTRRNEMVLSIDLAPTLLAIAGIQAPASMQGKSMLPLMERVSSDQSPNGWREHYYYEHSYQTAPPRSPIPKTEGIRTTRWKYIRYPDTTPVFEQLFDLENDPLERVNLVSVSQHQNQLADLRTLCDSEPGRLR